MALGNSACRWQLILAVFGRLHAARCRRAAEMFLGGSGAAAHGPRLDTFYIVFTFYARTFFLSDSFCRLNSSSWRRTAGRRGSGCRLNIHGSHGTCFTRLSARYARHWMTRFSRPSALTRPISHSPVNKASPPAYLSH